MRITLPSGTPAELATPPGDHAPTTAMVVIPDIFGLRPLFDDLCATLAERTGWAVVAAEPFPGRESMAIEQRFEAMAGLRDTQVVGDVLAAADATGADRVVVIGFCMGGMYALKAAGTGCFAAAAAFYGMIRIPADWSGGIDQAEPLDALASPQRCRTMAIVGTADPYTPAPDVDALDAAGVTVVRYEGAEHGFVHDPARPAHRADDAADAWTRVLTFLSD
jgi:carboxymethylenebutenolidase